MPAVSLERRDDGLRLVTLDRPERRNALGGALREELVAAVAELRGDDHARALVIAAEGPAFCAGADLDELLGSGPPAVGELRAALRAYYQVFLDIAELPFPTISAVQGPAVGAGVNLALCCDVCVAGPNARFGVTFARLGLHPGGGATYFMVEALGRRRALAVLLGGESLSAQEAVALGLALELAEDPRTAALELAARYARLRPSLARDIKRAVRIAATQGIEATVEWEAWAQADSATDPTVLEAFARSRSR